MIDEAGSEKTDFVKSPVSVICISVRESRTGVPAGAGYRSIRKALAAAKDKAKQLNAARDKVKKIDRGREI